MSGPQSNEPVTPGEGFAFFRAHCIAYDGSHCRGLDDPSCLLWEHSWKYHQTALTETSK